jgi:flagellar basal-body rod modification protein FlgD
MAVGPVSNQNQQTDPSTPGKTPQAASDPMANESTFLTLLVSQLKNQNPASPMDGTTFVTQLAQFSNLEQSLAMRQDMDTISLKYAGSSSIKPADSSNGDSASSGSKASS